MTLRFIELKDMGDLNNSGPISGVCYAPATEQIIRKKFASRQDDEHEPTIIGYLVAMDDDKDDSNRKLDNLVKFTNIVKEKDGIIVVKHCKDTACMMCYPDDDMNHREMDEVQSPTRADRDRAREAELVSRTRIKTNYDLRELGAIRRRLGRGVV